MILDYVRSYSTEWKLSIIINCNKGNRDRSERGDYRRLKSKDQILKIAKKTFKKLMREQVDID